MLKRYHICLLVALAFFRAYPICADESDDVHFYFVQISDTHFGDGDHAKRVARVVDRINNLPMKIECVVHTGDITMNKILDEATLTNARSVLGDLQVPIHYVPGNHDFLPKLLEETRRTYESNFGTLISKAEYKGVVFIFICTEPLAQSFILEGFEPLKELEGYLQRADGRPVLLFHHTPSVEDFYRNKIHEGWKRKFRDKWEKFINTHNVKAVIAGHFHRDEHHWLGNVPLYVCSPVAGYWGRQATFRIYEFKNGKISYRTQYIKPN